MKQVRTKAGAPSAIRRVELPDWEQLFMELWTASQGIVHALDTFTSDKAWADAHPDTAYVGSKEKLGRSFSVQRARARLGYDELLPMKEVSDKIRELGIHPLNSEDRRRGR